MLGRRIFGFHWAKQSFDNERLPLHPAFGLFSAEHSVLKQIVLFCKQIQIRIFNIRLIFSIYLPSITIYAIKYHYYIQ